jgi:hypothetical protein
MDIQPYNRFTILIVVVLLDNFLVDYLILNLNVNRTM